MVHGALLDKDAGAVEPSVVRAVSRGFDFGGVRKLHVEHQIGGASEAQRELTASVARQRADAFGDTDLPEHRLCAGPLG